MPIRVLLSVPPPELDGYRGAIMAACAAAGLEVTIETDAADLGAADLAAIDYLVFAPDGPVRDFAPFTGLRAALSLWAGVERVVGDPRLSAPLCRMVDAGLTEGMIDYVCAHVLRHHVGLDAVLAGQDGVWRHDAIAPLARERAVGVLGLGALGRACATALARHGFRVLGWSRRPAEIAGVVCRSGPDGLDAVLAGSEILVALLPATSASDRLLDAGRLARLPPGAVVINPGRGGLIDDAALLAALDRGHLAHATLDVFRTEPLPPEHPFWSHPKVTVTPHVAAATRPASAAAVIAENIRRGEAGAPFLHLVDRAQGY